MSIPHPSVANADLYPSRNKPRISAIPLGSVVTTGVNVSNNYRSIIQTLRTS